MGHAVHQMFVDLMAETFAISLCSFRSCAALMMVNRSFSVYYLFNQFLRLVDTVGNLYLDDRLSVKTCHLHIFIRRDDDTVAGGNLFFCQYIFCSGRTVGLRLHRNSQFFSFFFQSFRSHVRVGDTGRAGSYRQNPVTGSRLCCFRRFF